MVDEELEVADLEKTESKEPVFCEVAIVNIVRLPDVDVTLRVPAFTRTEGDFRTLVGGILDAYVNGSEQAGEPLSVSDFAFYLLTRAQLEPRVQA